MNVACLYGLYDPLTGELRYIGNTTTSSTIRLKRHLEEARLCPNKRTHKLSWLRSLSTPPTVKTLAILCDKQEAYRVEQRYIERLRFRGTRLVNANDGGLGSYGWRHTEDFKKKVGDRQRGKIVSTETRQKLSITGRSASLETRQKISVTVKNQMTPERRQQISETSRAGWVKRRSQS